MRIVEEIYKNKTFLIIKLTEIMVINCETIFKKKNSKEFFSLITEAITFEKIL